jgi:hypothetical protein|uniref:Uncharacterized protein n=1 Tax=Haptolina ericina TaxID=156174 RepID=A0A7S3B7M6_9EUKA|mmetsp:Transcript_52773/g.118465  ORF Transcript_52773/g.118465 Transcript_52773/m.118465 type:complete len:103 (+) Transcript_52773:130-438(+)
MWIDKNHNWHMLYEGGCNCDVGHSWSRDGITWSNITGAWNETRPVLNANGSITNVSYYIGRPKFMLGADGFTPTHLLGGAGSPVKTSPMTSLTIVSPLAGGL